MSRPYREGIQTKWKLSLDATVAGRVEHILLDPLSGRPRYGARARLVEELLKRWALDIERGTTDLDEEFLRGGSASSSMPNPIEMRRLLEHLNSVGGLDHDIHSRIDRVLNGESSDATRS